MKYLRPTDDFCMLKSWSAAKKEFARNGYYGKIVLGLTLLTRTEPLPKLFIGPQPPEQLRVVQWVCYAGTSGIITVPAFYHEESYAPYGDIRLLCEIPAGTTFVYDEEIFCFEHETVEIDGQKLEDWTIFSLAYIDNEEMAKFVAMVWGEKPLSATLNKCTIINDGRLNTEFSKCENYVIPVWKIRCEANKFRLLAAFTDDYVLFGMYDFNTLNWQPVPPGKGFLRDKKYYVVSDSPDKGYCFTEGLSVSVGQRTASLTGTRFFAFLFQIFRIQSFQLRQHKTPVLTD